MVDHYEVRKKVYCRHVRDKGCPIRHLYQLELLVDKSFDMDAMAPFASSIAPSRIQLACVHWKTMKSRRWRNDHTPFIRELVSRK